MIDRMYYKERQEHIEEAERHMFQDLEEGRTVWEESLRYPELLLSLRAWKLRKGKD